MAVIADTYAPFDAGAGANAMEDLWRKVMRNLATPGVIQDVAGSLTLHADDTGMQVKVLAGEAWIRGHWGEWTSTKILPVVASHGTLPRKDRGVVRLDTFNNRLELDVLQGAAAATPAAPSVTETSTIWECSLGVIDIPATDTSIASTQVTADPRWAGQKPIVHTIRDVSFTVAVPGGGVDADLRAVNFTPHSDCHVQYALNIITTAANGASANFAEGTNPIYGIRLKRVSDGVVLNSTDRIYRADVIDWNTPAFQGQVTTAINYAPNVTLTRNTQYQLVLYGSRTATLGANVIHITGTVTEVMMIAAA